MIVNPREIGIDSIDFDRIRVAADGRLCVKDILLCFFSVDEYTEISAFCFLRRTNLLVFDKMYFPAQKGMPAGQTAQAIARAQLPFLLDAFNQGILAKQEWLAQKQRKEDRRIASTSKQNDLLVQKLHARNARADVKESERQQQLELAALAGIERAKKIEAKELAAFERSLIAKIKRKARSKAI